MPAVCPNAGSNESQEHVSQAAHAHEPVWKQAEVLGYHVCGINGCVLMDRHAGPCLFPELSGRRRSRGASETDFSPAPVQLQPKRGAHDAEQRQQAEHGVRVSASPGARSP